MSNEHHILITNDDGIDSLGLHELAVQIEHAGYNVTVAAPSFDASGVSASLGPITSKEPISITKRSILGFHGNAFAIDAPPALCVLLAQLGAFDAEFNVIVSGINAGLNTGRSVLHSGTVGAALAAQNFGFTGLAVSMSRSELLHWRTAATFAVKMLESMVNAPPRSVVNLNVPGTALEDVKGLRWGALAPFNAVRSTIRKRSADAVHLKMVGPPQPPASDTDLGLCQAGYASITSLHAGSEVWTSEIQPDQDFDPSKSIPGVTAGDELRPARTFLT